MWIPSAIPQHCAAKSRNHKLIACSNSRASASTTVFVPSRLMAFAAISLRHIWRSEKISLGNRNVSSISEPRQIKASNAVGLLRFCIQWVENQNDVDETWWNIDRINHKFNKIQIAAEMLAEFHSLFVPGCFSFGHFGLVDGHLRLSTNAASSAKWCSNDQKLSKTHGQHFIHLNKPNEYPDSDEVMDLFCRVPVHEWQMQRTEGDYENCREKWGNLGTL